MSEAIGPESVQATPKFIHEQPVLHEELGPELDGLQYWTKELANIADGAFARIDELEAVGAELPRWAEILQTQFTTMRQDGRVFQNHLSEDSEAIDYGHTLERHHTTVGSIKDWYRRLGPTNEAEDLIYPMRGAIDRLSAEKETADRDYLMGNLLEDVALRTESSHDRISLLKSAAEEYNRAGQRVGLRDTLGRAAFRQGIDCGHLILAERYKTGQMSEDTYYKQYEELQTLSAKAFLRALDDTNESSLGNGEMLEWASLLYIRHKYWSDETAGHNLVRSALLREDQAIYPWRAEAGHKPIWSFDTVITDYETGAVKRRIQLKYGNFQEGSERDRIYLPTVVTVIRAEKPGHELRDLLKRGSRAIVHTYETIHMDNMELAKRIKIDQEAIDAVEEIFSGVLT